MEVKTRYVIPILSTSNYHSWSKEIRSLFEQKGYLRFLEYQDFNTWFAAKGFMEPQQTRYLNALNEIDQSQRNDQEKLEARGKLDILYHNDLGRWSTDQKRHAETWSKELEKSRGLIKSLISTHWKNAVAALNTPLEIWNYLRVHLVGGETQTNVFILQQMLTIRKKPDENLQSYLLRYQDLYEKLTDNDPTFILPDQFLTVSIICFLPEEYKFLTRSLNQIPKAQLTIDYIREQFLLEDLREEANVGEKAEGVKREEALLLNQPKKELRKCSVCHKSLHPKVPPRFTLCRDCFLKSKANKEDLPSETKKEEKSNHVISCHVNHQKESQLPWIMDSGTSSSTSFDTNDFVSLKDRITHVYGPTGEKSISTKIGEVVIQVNNEDRNKSHSISLSNSVLNTDMKRKLMSVSQLTSTGEVNVVFTKEHCLVIKGGSLSYTGEVILSAKKSDGLYLIEDNIPKQFSNLNVESIKPISNMTILHKKYGHMSKEDLIRFANNNQIEIDEKEDIDCISCDKAKMKRKNFKKKPVNEELVAGEEVHSDLVGPFVPLSLGNRRYYVIYIDKYSNFIFGTTIKRKEEAGIEFEKVKEYILTQLGKRVKSFVSDGEGIYISNDFQEMIKLSGIEHYQTPTNTPQRNSLSERYHLTIMNLVRAVLFDSGLPNDLWGEAFNYVLYVLNRMVKRGNDKSRYEMLYGKKPNIDHIHKFGNYVIYKDTTNNIKKLDERGREGAYVGFDDASYLYRIYDLEKRKIIRSRDVKFIEDKKVTLDNLGVEFDFEDEEISENQVHIEDESEEEEVDEGIDYCSPPDQPKLQPPPLPVRVRIEPTQEAQIVQPQVVQPQVFGGTYPVRVRKKVDHTLASINKSENTKSGSASINIYNDPTSYEEAIESEDKLEWEAAMKREIDALNNLGTFDYKSYKPSGEPVVGTKWVFKKKLNRDGSVDKFKARLVVKGFSQVEGVNYYETYASVATYTTLRYIISTCAAKNLPIHHLDIDNAFLNSTLEEVVYVRLPTSLDSKVVKLNKSLYGLKQASRVWNEDLVSKLKEFGLEESISDPSLFIRKDDNGDIFGVALWVDDNFIFGNKEDTEKLSKYLSSKYGVKDLGPASYFCGIELDYLPNGVKIHQTAYTKAILTKFGFNDCKKLDVPNLVDEKGNPKSEMKFDNINLYQQAVGSLNYLVSVSRPDLAFSVSYVARNMSRPTQLDWENIGKIFRYIKGSFDKGIIYLKIKSDLVGYSDASYAEDLIDRRSVSGYVFVKNGGAISWKSKKQPIVTLSSTEAEYVALTKCAQESIWLDKLENDMLERKNNPTIIYEDNTGAISLSDKSAISDRSKHIQVRYHFIRECVKRKDLVINSLATQYMVADILTKCLGKILHTRHCKAMGMDF